MNNVSTINNPAPQLTADELDTLDWYLQAATCTVVEFMDEEDFTPEMNEDDPTTILTADQVDYLVGVACCFNENTDYRVGGDRWDYSIGADWVYYTKTDFIDSFNLEGSWDDEEAGDQ